MPLNDKNQLSCQEQAQWYPAIPLVLVNQTRQVNTLGLAVGFTTIFSKP